MKVYIDNDYKCYCEPAEGRIAVEAETFNGKSRAYIEGYHFVPAGCEWTREDGEVFEGETAFPWKDSQILELVQSAYEESLAELEDMRAALLLLDVEPVEEVEANG